MAGDDMLCCASDSGRRAAARESRLNGIDYVEVDCAQTTLTVHFLGRAPDWIEKKHVRIEGGERERGIAVERILIEPGEDEGIDDRMIVEVDRPGDFSTYKLCIVALDRAGKPTGKPPPDFDPRYACASFSFKANCPSDLDCAQPADCPEPALDEPAIDYLAKDYSSFRRLLLDRLALTLPAWRERHAPDVMVTLVELLAYAGDQLSYQQDAVAAEAYLDTARLRISVRRHARLVGYRMHEGCNARSWLAFEVSEPLFELAADDVYFTTAAPGREERMLRREDLEPPPPDGRPVFEPLLAGGAKRFTLRKAHNRISFHTWGESECCLAAGATRATLLDPGELPRPQTRKKRARRGRALDQDSPDQAARGHDHPDHCLPDPIPPDLDKAVSEGRWHALALAPGDVLLFEERIGPRTGDEADADPDHRHAVRLTRAERAFDPLERKLVWEIEWCVEDKLPFPLCLSATSDPPECLPLRDVSVALGNVVLADEGETVEETLEPEVQALPPKLRCPDDCAGAELSEVAERYRPRLPRPDPAFAAPYDPVLPCIGGCRAAAAAAALAQDVTACAPAVALTSYDPVTGAARSWAARADLLGSGPDDRDFVVEVDDRRIAWLRFGDGSCGCAPQARETFRARYRAGSGPAGNIGADTLVRTVFRNSYPDGVSLTVRNPMAAAGGTAPEPVGRAKLRAPHVFRTRLERAVAPADYAAIARRDFAADVQRAGAWLRGTGTGAEVQVAIDSFGSADPDPVLLRLIEDHLEEYRLIGHHLRVIPARNVPLLLEMTVCVDPAFLRAHVKEALQRVLGAGRWSGGRGFFHPDSLSLGDPIRLSRIAAAAHAVEGVASVIVTRLERLLDGPEGAVEDGVLRLRPHEVARLDNDPRFPERGTLTLEMRDGR